MPTNLVGMTDAERLEQMADRKRRFCDCDPTCDICLDEAALRAGAAALRQQEGWCRRARLLLAAVAVYVRQWPDHAPQFREESTDICAQIHNLLANPPLTEHPKEQER